MKITAVTADQLIIVDGIAAELKLCGGYHMKNGEWAVHYDTVSEVGEIEYIDNRLNVVLTKSDFDTHYAWLLTEHARVLEQVKADEQQSMAISSDSGDSISAQG